MRRGGLSPEGVDTVLRLQTLKSDGFFENSAMMSSCSFNGVPNGSHTARNRCQAKRIGRIRPIRCIVSQGYC